MADPMTPADNPAEVGAVARAMFAVENCGKSDDVDNRWVTCLNDDNREEYKTLARAAIQALDAYRATVAKTDTHLADIARVKAEAWDEGFWRRDDDVMSRLEDNPYRATIPRPDAPQNTGSGVGDE